MVPDGSFKGHLEFYDSDGYSIKRNTVLHITKWKGLLIFIKKHAKLYFNAFALISKLLSYRFIALLKLSLQLEFLFWKHFTFLVSPQVLLNRPRTSIPLSLLVGYHPFDQRYDGKWPTSPWKNLINSKNKSWWKMINSISACRKLINSILFYVGI